MIRVLNVMSSLTYGGVPTTVMNYYRNLDRTKIQFDFLLTLDGKHCYEAEAVSLGARIFRRPMRTKNPIGSALGLIRTLRECPKVDIIHIHNYLPLVAVDTLIAMFCGVKIRIAHSRNAMPKMPFWQKAFRPILRATATHLIGCSTEAGVSFFGEKARRTGRLTLFPNARNLEPYRYSLDRRSVIRQALELDNRFVLINVGRLDTQKNQDFLLEAFNLVQEKRSDMILLIAGDGELDIKLAEKTAELGIEDSVRFLGVRNDVPDLLQAADLFVLPSLYEGLPGTAIEAQAAGLPCLLADTITPECKITEGLEFLPIDKGPEVWGNRILSFQEVPRRDSFEEVRRAGYDIKEAAKRLEAFYMDAMKKKGS